MDIDIWILSVVVIIFGMVFALVGRNMERSLGNSKW